MTTDQTQGRAEYTGLGAREGSARGEQNISGRLTAMEALRPLTGSRLLDVGCGNGAYTLRMARRFGQTVGIDLEPDRIGDFRALLAAREAGEADPASDVARAGDVEVLLGSASDLSFPDGHFDTVTAIETMEHLGEHLDAVLREVARVLAPGGTFYLTTPNRWWPLEQHGFRTRRGWRPGWRFPFLTWVPAVHRRFSVNDAFTPWRLDRIVEPHGFRRTGLRFMMPPLDGHPGLRRVVGPAFAVVDATPLRRFAQTLVMTYERV